MPSVSNLLFVYGTLMRGKRRHGRLLEAGAAYVGRASIAGKLYRVPGKDYPAGIASENACNRVHGELYRLPHPSGALRLLDQVEGCREGMYRRELVSVRHAGTTLKSWTYFYLLPLGNAPCVANGRYRARTGTTK